MVNVDDGEEKRPVVSSETAANPSYHQDMKIIIRRYFCVLPASYDGCVFWGLACLDVS